MKPRLVVFVLACLLLLSGCGPGAQSGNPRPPGEPSPTQEADTLSPELEPEPESSLFPEKESGPVSEPAEVPAASPSLTRDYFQAKQIEVDADHIFWVELTETPEESPLDYDLVGGNGEGTVAVRVNIYRKQTDERPVQSFLDGYSCETGQMELCGHDYNFDGYEDFSFVNMHFGFRYCGYAHYIWDKQAEQFVQDPYGLNRLTNRVVHEEGQVITSYSSAAGGSESYWHHRYVDGELTVTRKCSVINPIIPEDGGFHIQVEDLVDGKWEQVYWSDKYEDEYRVYRLWRDGFDYHGDGAEFLAKQPIDDTHDAFLVPTGGKLGTLLVTVEQEEEGEEWPYRYNFSVWAAGDLKKPIQTMTAEGTALFGPELIDANFDGYLDFRYQRSWGTGGDFYHHWVWDEAAGQFVAMPELSEYGYIEFDAETQTVRGGMTAGVWHEDHIYRWECGELVFSRIIKQGLGLRSEEDDTLSTKVTVSDWVNGEWTEVWSEEFSEEDCWDEVAKWLDLSYHGET